MNLAKFSYSYILLFCGVFILSCYSPSGENYNDIEPPTIPSITFELNSFEGDSFSFAGELTFNFVVSFIENQFNYGIVLVDGLERYRFYNRSTEFKLRSYEISTGLHELEIQTYFDSGTNSLADQTGAENIVFTESWIFEVDNDPVTPVEVTSFSVEDSGLVIRWDKYERVNFTYYNVQRRFDRFVSSHAYENYRISNKNQNNLLINDITGGNYQYRVEVNCVCDNTGLAGEWVDINPGKSSLVNSIVTNNYLNLTWTQPPIRNSFDRYEIHEKSDFWGYSVSVYTDTSITDTSVTINYPFDGESSFWVEAASTNRTATRSDTVFVSGIPYPKFEATDQFYFNENTRESFQLTSNQIIKIDSTEGSKISSFDLNFSQPINSQFIGINDNRELELISQNSFNLIETIDLSPYISNSLDFSEIAASINGTILLLRSQVTTSEDSLFIFDFGNKQLVDKIVIESEDRIGISKNGTYFSAGLRHYSIFSNNVSLNETQTIDGNIFFDYFDDSIYHFVAEERYRIRVWTIDSNTQDNLNYYRYDADYSSLQEKYFDPNSGIFYSTDLNWLYIFHPLEDRHDRIRIIERDEYYKFHNGLILASNGYKVRYDY